MHNLCLVFIPRKSTLAGLSWCAHDPFVKRPWIKKSAMEVMKTPRKHHAQWVYHVEAPRISHAHGSTMESQKSNESAYTITMAALFYTHGRTMEEAHWRKQYGSAYTTMEAPHGITADVPWNHRGSTTWEFHGTQVAGTRPPCTMWVKQIIVKTLNNAAHHYVVSVPRRTRELADSSRSGRDA